MSKPATENLTIVQGETFDRSIRLCSYLRSVNDASMVVASNVLTSNCGAFTASDIGRRVLINDAGVNGGIMDSIIVSVSSPTTVVLSDAAIAAVSKSLATIYTPVDLTGWTITSQIRDDEFDGNLLAEFTVVVDALIGRVTRSLLESESLALPPGKAWHDLKMEDTLFQLRVYTRGRLNVLSRITV